MAILLLRVRLWLAPMTGWLRRRFRMRHPMAVLFPLALVMATATIVFVAKFSNTPRCAATTAVATAKPHARGRLIPNRACRPFPTPLLTGR